MWEGIRFSVALDAGNIELLHANYRKRYVPAHFHEGYSIAVTLRGGLAFDQRGSRFVAPSGVISAINPREVHNAYPAEKGRWAFRCFLIPVEFLAGVALEATGRDRLPAFPQRVVTDSVMARRLPRLHRILESPGQGSCDLLEKQSRCVATLAEFVLRHTTLSGATPAIPDERPGIRRARDFLNDCYPQRLSLAQLAEIAGLSRYHFLRVFHVELGLTPHAYLNHVRVLRAKHLLSSGVAIAEAALRCGFADQSHLARHFKRFLAITPGQYQAGQSQFSTRRRPRHEVGL